MQNRWRQDSKQGSTNKDSHSTRGATTKDLDSPRGSTTKGSHSGSPRGVTTKDSDSMGGSTTKDSHSHSTRGSTTKDSHSDSTQEATTKDSDSTQGATIKDSRQDSTRGATTKDPHSDSTQGATTKDPHSDSTQGATTKDSHSDFTQGATTKDSHSDSTQGATTKDSDSTQGATTKDSHSDSTQGATTKDSHSDSTQRSTTKDPHSDSAQGATIKDSNQDSAQGATTKDSDSTGGCTTKDSDSPQGATTKGSHSDSMRGATTKDSDSPRGAITKDSDYPRGATTKDSDSPRGATTKDSDYPRGATTKDSDSTRGATTKDLDSDSMQGSTTKDLDSDSMQGATTKDLDSDSMRGATTKDLDSDSMRGTTTKKSDSTQGATTKDSRLEDVGMCLAKIMVIKKDDSLGAIYHMNEEECVIGSGRECNIKVSLTNVDNIHAVVAVDRFKASVTNFSKKFPVILNGKPIEIGKELNDGDMLVIGGRKFLFNHKKSCNSHSDLFEDSSEHSDPFDPDYEMSEDADNVTSEDSCDEIIEEEVELVSDSGSDVIPYQGPLQFLDQEETVSSTSELMALNSASKHQKQRATDFVIKNDIISSTVKDVEVQQSRNQDGIRVWDKVHYCVYCEKGFTNITKHYLGVHSNETVVQHIKSHPLKSTNRKLALMKLRNSGDFQHNYEVLRTRHGTLVTFTRNWNKTSADQFLPCQYCLGFFLKSSLWRHTKNCPFAPERKEKYRKVSSQSMLLLPTSTDVSEGLREKVLSRMSADEISIAARNDPIIVRVGEKLYQKHGHLTHLYTYVSQKMREHGRLLILLRETDKDINSLDDAIHPKKYPAVVKCTKTLCGFQENSNSYNNPSLALKLGHSLKKCAKIKNSLALIQGNGDSTKDAEGFFTLCENEWTDSVSSSAFQTLASNKLNKGHGLPLAEDIQKMQTLLKEKTEELVIQLQKSVKKSVWDELNQVTLARLVMFNRRRGGESERMTLASFCEKRSKSDSLKEIEDSLKPLERILCKTFSRVEIRGKRGRMVPILITPALERSIVLLNETREQAGVSKSNPYVFARSGFSSLNPIRSSDCLRKFAEESGVKNTRNLTSTKLRKHVATVSQILNLEKSDIEIMAGFLGHDIRVHTSFYRLPSDTLQIARMGTILTAFDNGEISKYSGKSLDQIACEDIKLGNEEGEEDMSSSGEESDEDNCHRGKMRKLNPPKEAAESESDSEEDNENAHGMAKKEREHGKNTKTGSSKKPGSDDQYMKGKPKRVPNTRHQWTQDEKAALLRKFKKPISLGKTPGQLDCLNAIRQETCLAKFTWKQIKFAVKNIITSERRQVKKMTKQV